MLSKKCVLCGTSLKNSKKTNVGPAGLINLIKISEQRRDTAITQIFRSEDSIQLHLKCRNKYVSDIHLLSKNVHNRENECGEKMEVDYEFMEGFGAIPPLDDTGIDNIEMQTELGEESSEQVINDSALKDSAANHQNIAFEKTCTYMTQADECEFKIEDLQAKMQSFLSPPMDPYGPKYFLKKLTEKFNNEIVITNGRSVEKIICFRRNLNNVIASKISASQSDDEIIWAAGNILKKKIERLEIDAHEYPSLAEISNGGADSMPAELRLLMKALSPKNPSKTYETKSLAIQNAIVSLVRPRFISPILLGIGTLFHRKTNSRYLVDTLSSFGFSSSYKEVLNMQKCAATEPQRKKLQNAYIQHSWDNADINIRTLTGHGTWHSLGGLECVTPSTSSIVSSNLRRFQCKLSAEELGKYGTLAIKSYTKPKGNGLKNMKVESVFDYLAQYESNLQSYFNTDLLWLCGRLFNLYFAPSWFGYNEHITSEIRGFAQTKTTPLPFINLDPGNPSTIYTALSFTASQCKELDQDVGFVTFDQPIYVKAVTIVKSADSSSDISKLVVRLGGFHLLMSFLGTIGYIMNGSGIEEMYNTVYAKNTVVHMMSGHAYSRSLRGCLLAQEAISHLILEKELQFADVELSYLQSVFETYDASENIKLDEPLLDKIKSTFKAEFSKWKLKSRTAKLWIQFWEMVQIVKDFIKAERTGDWNGHLLCVRKMLPYFHAAGRLQYAKCAQIYLQDMMDLEKRMSSEEFKKFVKESFFTVRRTSKYFSGTWTDMVIEQDLMRAIKVSGGLKNGRGTTDNSLAIWMGALPFCIEVINSVEKFTGKTFKTSEQHVELRTSREKTDRNDLVKFKNWLKNHNPFDEYKPELYSISTGVVAAPIINCDEAETIGLKSMQKMVKLNFEEIKMSTAAKVKPLGFTSKSIKLNGKDVMINPHQLFNRMLTVMPSAEKLKESFDFELASYPLSLFGESGIREHNPAPLFDYFDKIPGQINIEFTQSDSIFFVSGELLLRKVVWSCYQTFGEIIDQYVQYVMVEYGRNARIFFNGSTTGCHSFTQRKVLGSKEMLFEHHIKVTGKQSEILDNRNNKSRVVDCLIKRFREEDIQVFQAENKCDRIVACAAVSTAEEFANMNIVVVGDELDLLVLLIYHADLEFDNMFMLRPGKKTTKTSHINIIQNELGNVRRNILTIHAISGTSTISAFYKKGKVSFLKKALKSPDVANGLNIFNDPNANIGVLFEAGLKLLLKVYGANKNTKDINSCRYELFNKINRKKKLSQEFELACLPPTQGAAEQHILRTFFQVQEWSFNILDPAKWGWVAESRIWDPIKTINTEVAPNWLLQSIFCSCKHSCTICSCKKFNLSCSEACNCLADCTNRTQTDHSDDDNV